MDRRKRTASCPFLIDMKIVAKAAEDRKSKIMRISRSRLAVHAQPAFEDSLLASEGRPRPPTTP